MLFRVYPAAAAGGREGRLLRVWFFNYLCMRVRLGSKGGAEFVLLDDYRGLYISQFLEVHEIAPV